LFVIFLNFVSGVRRENFFEMTIKTH